MKKWCFCLEMLQSSVPSRGWKIVPNFSKIVPIIQKLFQSGQKLFQSGQKLFQSGQKLFHIAQNCSIWWKNCSLGWSKDVGLKHTTAPPWTPQFNPFRERAHDTIVIWQPFSIVASSIGRCLVASVAVCNCICPVVWNYAGGPPVVLIILDPKYAEIRNFPDRCLQNWRNSKKKRLLNVKMTARGRFFQHKKARFFVLPVRQRWKRAISPNFMRLGLFPNTTDRSFDQ